MEHVEAAANSAMRNDKSAVATKHHMNSAMKPSLAAPNSGNG